MNRSEPDPASSEGLDLIQGLRRALQSPTPLPLLEAASMVVAVSSPQRPENPYAPRPSEPTVLLESLIETFTGADLPETDALLRVLARMLGDASQRASIEGVIARSAPRGPSWLSALDEVRPIRALAVGDVFHENETLLIEIAAPQAPFVLAVAVDFEAGTMITDAYAIPLSFARALSELDHEHGAEMRRSPKPLNEIRSLIEWGLGIGDMTIPSVESDTWPGTRPLLEWMLRLMPEGPQYEPREWGSEELAALADDFLASRHASDLDDAAATQAVQLFGLQASHGTGEPLLWGGAFVERVMCDLFPRKVLADEQYMASMPQTLRRLVQYANERSGVPVELTERVLEVIDDCVPDYFERISDPYPMGYPSDDDFGGPALARGAFVRSEPGDWQRFQLHELSQEVGGEEALETLDVEPLPVEVLREEGIDGDILPRVRRTARMVEEISTDYFDDPEMTTAALRVLARVARSDPKIFRRRSKDETAAAAVCWIIGQGHEWFSHADSARTVQSLMQTIGRTGSPRQRAEPMMRALGLTENLYYGPIKLGDPTLLVSRRRNEIIMRRDDLLEALREIEEDASQS